MLMRPKAAALTLGVLGALSAAALAQTTPRQAPPAPARSAGDAQTLVLPGSFDWLERSDVSAQREGVIRNIEFQVGRRVKKGDEIGGLEDESARLAMAKAEILASNKGQVAEAEAKKELALAVLARLRRLESHGRGMASQDDIDKAIAEVKVADAQRQTAIESQKGYQAEFAIAKRAFDEHKILAPFDGVIIDRFKNRGEAVMGREPVLRLARTDTVKMVCFTKLETALKVKEGDLVLVRPTVDDADLPIERVQFRGRVTSISNEVNPVNATEARIIAEVENRDPSNPDKPLPSELELRANMRGEMTIFLNGAAPAAAGNGLVNSR